MAHNSIAVFPLSLGGCNGCRLEFDAIFNPPYNAERYGLRRVHSPRHADVILLTGVLTARTAPVALRVLAELPDDVQFVAIGSCALTGAPYAQAPLVIGPITGRFTDEEVPLTPPADPALDDLATSAADSSGTYEEMIAAVEGDTSVGVASAGVPVPGREKRGFLPSGRVIAVNLAGCPPDPQSILEAIRRAASTRRALQR